ncbi:MAG: hypothetical protein ABI193_05335, partial [Minicystis sp.]
KCASRHDYYSFCGDCRRCLEEQCCAQIIACENSEGCMDCVSGAPDATTCGEPATGNLAGCSFDCIPCHSSPPMQGCSVDAGADGGGSGGAGGG